MTSYAHFQSLRFCDERSGLGLDLSHMGFSREALDALAGPMALAFSEMEALEKGSTANPDEGRKVGHFWLRTPRLTAAPEARKIHDNVTAISDFAGKIHEGYHRPSTALLFDQVVQIGIGGSALGPRFLVDALAGQGEGLEFHCLDNTDPDGCARLIARLGDGLRRTLVLVVSKSGATCETRNGMLEFRHAMETQGFEFAKHAVAVTGAGSHLDALAQEQGWLARFPIPEWVGGRFSLCSSVGLLPAALTKVDINLLLAGASAMDDSTRSRDLFENPAALLAAAIHISGDGRGDRDMVVLPYRDRLALLGCYLQQLFMESLGKNKDRQGNVTQQGITVYGNKGSTDQHAFVQQLREGLDRFFVCFVRVLEDGETSGIFVETGSTSGDFLDGFWLGTRAALSENDRPNLTISLPRLSAFEFGALIALFERTVGLYASLIDINAYHQPGVEAGKKAAAGALLLSKRILAELTESPIEADALAERIGAGTDAETCFLILERLAANPKRSSVRRCQEGWLRDRKS